MTRVVFVPLPYPLRRVIPGGCQCPYCKAHPNAVPTWDTVGFDGKESWTVHFPDWLEASANLEQ